MGISTPGIGSGLDVDGIVTKLMAVESAPLADFDKKSLALQTKVSALGTLSAAVGTFQGALSGLTSLANFQSVSATPGDTTVLSGSATNKAVAGNYSINVTQLAQAQTLASTAVSTPNTAIGLGNATTITFQLGTVSGGSFGEAGTALGQGVAASGISNGALTINGTAIATDSSTRSAKALAAAINAKNTTTGVTALAGPASSAATAFGGAGAASFGTIDTSAGGTYSLAVNGIEIVGQASGTAAGIDAAAIDTVLSGNNSVTAALTAANISFTGSAANGDLVFTAADGANLTLGENVTGAVSGGLGKTSATANNGSGVTTTSGVTLSSTSASQISIGGSAPALAGLTAGLGGSYLGASFAQDPTRLSGTVTIDSNNNTLQGILTAINKANLGVTATIVSDGSAVPNRLILTSTASGANSSIKISLAGVNGTPADTALSDLLAYDPTGVQKLSQNTAAQDTALTVQGVAITSHSNTVSEAAQGVTLSLSKVGATSLAVARDTGSVGASVNVFIKAYNDLNKAISDATAVAPDLGKDNTKTSAPLVGDPVVRSLQTQLRKQLSVAVTGLDGGTLTTLSQVGIGFQKDGSLALDSSKLGDALTNHFDDIAGLFAAVGKASDPLVAFKASTSATTPGDYALHVTTLATQGSLSGLTALGPATTIAANTSWTVTINDTDPSTPSHSATVALKAGTYSPTELAVLLQSAINGANNFSSNGLAVNVTADATGKLNLVSTKYGSLSNVALSSTSGTTVANLFGGASPVVGVDVAGTLGGQSATGSGQTLTGSAGSPVEGLKVDITGGATGDRGSVGFSQGYAYQLNNLAANFLGADGLFTGESKGLTKSVSDVAKQKSDFNDRLADIEKRYRAQYTALDTSIASLNSTQTFLTQQFAAIAKQ